MPAPPRADEGHEHAALDCVGHQPALRLAADEPRPAERQRRERAALGRDADAQRLDRADERGAVARALRGVQREAALDELRERGRHLVRPGALAASSPPRQAAAAAP